MANRGRETSKEEIVTNLVEAEVKVEEAVADNTVNLGQNIEPKISTSVDMGNGKVMLHTEGLHDGYEVSININGKSYNVEISDNFGVAATGHSFSKYPAIQVIF